MPILHLVGARKCFFNDRVVFMRVRVLCEDALWALGQIGDNNPSTVSALLAHLMDHSRISAGPFLHRECLEW